MKDNITLTLHEEVFLLLLKSYGICKKITDDLLQEYHITLSEFTFLRVIENTPRITASDIRKRLCISAPSVTQLVKNLEKKDFILRLNDVSDIRRQPIDLTKKGGTLIKQARKAIDETFKQLSFSQSDLSSMKKSLSSLFSSLSSYGD